MAWNPFKKKRFHDQEVFPDEIFMDARNLPKFNEHQFEGHIEKSISRRAIYAMALFFCVVSFIFIGKTYMLQVTEGSAYAEKSENNRLRHDLVFAERGLIYDRNDTLLAWNVPTEEEDFTKRNYVATSGFAHLLGYVSYPKKDKKGYYFDEKLVGKDGVERYFDSLLAGNNGLQITETNALGKTLSESVLRPPEHGAPLKLSVDARIQAKLHAEIKGLADRVGFQGGAGAIMDVHTGEIIAYTSYPEFSPAIMTESKDATIIGNYFSDKRKFFLNRLTDGLYTPGSIVKPIVALAALEEGTIDPLQNIYSAGKLVLPNRYDPSKPTIFGDWKAHGYTDMRRAIAVSSDVYFYQVGGGFENVKGLGITKLEKYYRLFGYSTPMYGFFEGKTGVIPNPEWKKENFDGDDWRVGDTYFMSIGQYGFQITPMEGLRAVAALANKGKIIEPTITKVEKGEKPVTTDLDINPVHYKVIHEGMRQAVLEGTAKALNVSYVEVAGKSGTAELGVSKAKVNSWIEGFWPYSNPRYAFIVMMEQGDRTNTIGSAYVMRQVIDWMHLYAPEYVN
jgi:penicillin-binding protein 2